ncbi:unnamed protein product, partial [Rotaria socialis]
FESKDLFSSGVRGADGGFVLRGPVGITANNSDSDSVEELFRAATLILVGVDAADEDLELLHGF